MQTEPCPYEPEETREPIAISIPMDYEMYGTDEIYPKPGVEFMYPLDFIPGVVPDSTSQDGPEEVRDWAESSLYKYVSTNFIR